MHRLTIDESEVIEENQSSSKAQKIVGQKNINGKKVIHIANYFLVIPYHFGAVDPKLYSRFSAIMIE